MPVVATILTALAALVVLIWTSRHLLITREQRLATGLGEHSPGAPDDPPRVTFLVAAKDEEDNLERCVDGLLMQDYPNFELIICDDRSTDRTPEIADRLAEADPRVRVVHVEDLPEGWCGKNHAMWTGIRQSQSDWIGMTDADCRQLSTRTLSVAVRHALDTGADMLSVLPKLEMVGFWENVIQPVCSGCMMVWFHPDKVNDPAKPNAYANGAFILISRSAYEAIGTHEAVKGSMLEDMHMARKIKSSGRKLTVVRNDRLYDVRMYTDLGAILRGWRRIFLGSFLKLRRLVAGMTIFMLMGIYPYVAAVLGFALAALGGQAAPYWLACGCAGAAAIVLQQTVVYRFYRLIGARPGLAWTYLLGNLLAIVILLMAILKHARGTTVVWKGTDYPSVPTG